MSSKKQRPPPTAGPDSAASRPFPASAKRRWFRLAALALPWLLLAGIEGLLRLAGYGYPTGFFLKRQAGGRPVWIENQAFPQRFFPPGLTRAPEPVLLPATKGSNTCRIFIFGESAALGDPEPAFGFGRMLDVLLSARYPETHFEVVNVAFTAINSHVIRLIARDCARHQGDFWVVYMGNNEVVGPFGAGTVFGAQTPPRWLVRAQLALKTTRLGQGLDALRWRLARPPGLPAQWEGMEMFLQQQIRPEDRRMRRVYDSFRHNLEDIVQQGTAAGARVLVSIVVGNLKDCPPFGSLLRPDLSPEQRVEWTRLYEAGRAHEGATNSAAALAAYTQAAHLDASHAELVFRQGRCHWALGDFAAARRCFELALDLDTLRFRADSRLNEIIRQVATNLAARGVKLLDAQAAFAARSPQGVVGEELLWEHVHLNFDGNYLLARAVAEHIADWLAKDRARSATNQAAWLTADECAQRLALTDWDRYQLVDEVFKRVQNPPFTHQADHEAHVARLQAARAALRPATRPAAFPAAAALYREALARRPTDWVLHENFARLLEAFGELGDAAAQWRRVTELVPHHAQGWFGLANVLEAQGETDQAIAVYRGVLARQPDQAEARHGLALALANQGKTDRAAAEFRRLLRLRPGFVEARVNLGLLLARQGRTNEALAQYAEALRQDSNHAPAHINLGRLLASQGQLTQALAHYQEAVRLNPDSAVAHYNLGNTLAALGRAEAAQHYAEAVRANPAFVEARFKWGIELARQGRAEEALAQFQEAVRLRPDSAEAHMHLGTALARARRFDEAIVHFRETLRLEPAYPGAREFLEHAEAARRR